MEQNEQMQNEQMQNEIEESSDSSNGFSINTILLGVIALLLGIQVINSFGEGGNNGGTNEATVASTDPTVNAANNTTPTTINDLTKPTPPVTEPAKPTGPPTSVMFAQSQHDFGKIDQDTKNTYTFKFTNTGINPLTITDAKGSCGCTVPQYPKEPIPPGGSGDIQVEYSPAKQKGPQSKTVTVTANTNPPTTTLTIIADVQEIAAE